MIPPWRTGMTSGEDQFNYGRGLHFSDHIAYGVLHSILVLMYILDTWMS